MMASSVRKACSPDLAFARAFKPTLGTALSRLTALTPRQPLRLGAASSRTQAERACCRASVMCGGGEPRSLYKVCVPSVEGRPLSPFGLRDMPGLRGKA